MVCFPKGNAGSEVCFMNGIAYSEKNEEISLKYIRTEYKRLRVHMK